MLRFSISCVCMMLVFAWPAPGAEAQESQSVKAAAELTRLLQERSLDAVAARDPVHPDRFIAALHLPGSQLLVIASVHAEPAALVYRIAERQYRDVYTDLHGSRARDGRVFVTDLQANGLRRRREPGEPFDIVYRNGVDQASYDGDWKEQKLTEAQYNQRFEKDDAEYARMLTVLADALRSAQWPVSASVHLGEDAGWMTRVDGGRRHCGAHR